MQHHGRRVVAVAGAILITIPLNAVAATAAADDSFDRVVAHVERVQPLAGPVEALPASGAATTIPDVAGRKVTLDLVTAEVAVTPDIGPDLGPTLSLPKELGDVRAGVVDGHAVFLGDEASATVQVLSSGVQVSTVTPSRSAPHEFTYIFDGATPALNEDGTVVLEYDTPAGPTFTLGVLERPWAFDAKGRAVPTHYEVTEDSVVQVIEASSSATYPIVADPKWTWGVGLYAHFNRAETAAMPDWNTAAISAACAAGGFIAGAPGAAALGSACGLVAENVKYQARVANYSSPKKCLYIRFVPLGLLTSAQPGIYRDKRCK